MTIEEAREFLKLAGVFYETDEEDDKEFPKIKQTLNLNDAFYWACADGEYVPDEELPEVARLFHSYGMCGIYYWVAKNRNVYKVEFVDINRFIDFVKHEEDNIKEEPDWDKRGYRNITYTLGE